VALAGTAADASGVAAVTWTNSQGGSGTAAGTTSWSVSGVALRPGVNVITIAARDIADNVGRAQLTVTFTPDTRPPDVSIVSYALTAPGFLRVVGSASDDVGLASVAWRAGRDATGVAVGTTSWVATMPIGRGATDITLTATDLAGNSATTSLKVFASKLETSRTSSTATVNDAGGSTGISVIATGAALPPQLSILTPDTTGRWVSSASTVSLQGTATDNVTRVTWRADWGGSGTASGTRAWTIATVGLQIGKNVVTVTATTADGRTASQAVTIFYAPLRTSAR
jgi:hypothetical protein